MEDSGTATRSMALDGRVLVEDVDCTMMGAPMTGHGMTGYDNVSGKYWSTWTDSMSTGIMVSQGICDAKQQLHVHRHVERRGQERPDEGAHDQSLDEPDDRGLGDARPGQGRQGVQDDGDHLHQDVKKGGFYFFRQSSRIPLCRKNRRASSRAHFAVAAIGTSPSTPAGAGTSIAVFESLNTILVNRS